MGHSPSKIVDCITQLEVIFKISIKIGLIGSVIFGSGVIFYIIIGVFGIGVNFLTFPYPFLSLNADPFFVIGSAIVGLFLVQSSISLLLYHFLVGFGNMRARISVLVSFASLGFAGGVLRLTFFPAVRLLFDAVHAGF